MSPRYLSLGPCRLEHIVLKAFHPVDGSEHQLENPPRPHFIAGMGLRDMLRMTRALWIAATFRHAHATDSCYETSPGLEAGAEAIHKRQELMPPFPTASTHAPALFISR